MAKIRKNFQNSARNKTIPLTLLHKNDQRNRGYAPTEYSAIYGYRFPDAFPKKSNPKNAGLIRNIKIDNFLSIVSSMLKQDNFRHCETWEDYQWDEKGQDVRRFDSTIATGGGHSITDATFESGVIVVDSEKIGMFWSFDED